MFGIGLPELFIILVIAIIVIGPDKLPDLARAVGKGIGEFRRATDELKSSFDSDDDLREIKTQLTKAKEDMTSMVREHTKGMTVDSVAKSLEDGSLFEDKAKKAQDESSEPSSETTGSSPADPSSTGPSSTDPSSTNEGSVNQETNEAGAMAPDKNSDLPESQPPKPEA